MGYLIHNFQSFTGNSEDLAKTAVKVVEDLGLPGDHEKINERLVRYYVSEGLVSKPARIGRDAEYSYLHLLQFLGSRYLVDQGYSLAKVGPYVKAMDQASIEKLLILRNKPNLAELLVASYKDRNPSQVLSPKAVKMQKSSSRDILQTMSKSNSNYLTKFENLNADQSRVDPGVSFESKRANLIKTPKNSEATQATQLNQTMEKKMQEITDCLHHLQDQLQENSNETRSDLRLLQCSMSELVDSINEMVHISQKQYLEFMHYLKDKEVKQDQLLSQLDDKLTNIEKNSFTKNAQAKEGEQS